MKSGELRRTKRHRRKRLVDVFHSLTLLLLGRGAIVSLLFLKNLVQVTQTILLPMGGGVLLLLGVVVVAEAAHSRRRIVVRSSPPPRYDRSITTFDPTGRLLQVEYGMEAANRGSSFLVALIRNVTEEEDKRREGGRSSSSCCAWIITESGSATSSSKVHRLAPHIFLITSGLAGDARALASSLRSFCARHTFSMGEPPTVSEVAREAASLQHALTRMGGARPLGCTAVIVGMDDSSCSSGSSSLRVFQTDPGGILEECSFYCAGGMHQALLLTTLNHRYAEVLEATAAAASLSHTYHHENIDISFSDNNNNNTSPTAAASIAASSMLLKVFADSCGCAGMKTASQDDATARLVDVWRIQAAPTRRGGLSTMCFVNVPIIVTTSSSSGKRTKGTPRLVLPKAFVSRLDR